MSFLEGVRARARAHARRLVFPEGADARTLEAVAAIARDGLAIPVVLGGELTAGDLRRMGAAVEVVDPATDARRPQLAAHLYERRRAKGMTEDEALRHAGEPLLFAALMVAAGEADGSVAGAVHATGDVIRAALWGVGPAAGIRTVSSSFYMVVPPFRGEAEVLTFTDAGVVPDPTAEQLADIAAAAADARRRVVGDEPRVALLSFSTKGSGGGRSVAAVAEATALVRARAPELIVDGELQ
ncbi:MAG: phosphate acetyltransferase, partial [Gemmatimonadetes bacterium]|nr:phosphate acetyltransferase [Gemmatimonadota bacterium]